MAQDRSTKIISTIQWIRTSRLSMKNSVCVCIEGGLQGYLAHETHPPPQDRLKALGMVPLLGPWGGVVSYERGTPVSREA